MRYLLITTVAVVLLVVAIGELQPEPIQRTSCDEPVVVFVRVPVVVPVVHEHVTERAVSDSRGRLIAGMQSLAETENVSLERLSKRYGWKVELVADLALGAGSRYNVDPYLIVAIAWQESRWNPRETHDHGRGCGITGVLHDRRGRPSCNQLFDPAVSIDWTARRLSQLTSPNGGGVRLAYYNGGGGKKAQRYEIKVRRWADVLRRDYETDPSDRPRAIGDAKAHDRDGDQG